MATNTTTVSEEWDFFFLCIKAEISSHNQVDINLNLEKKKNQVIGFVMMQSVFLWFPILSFDLRLNNII